MHDYATLQTIRERAEVNSTDQIALLEGTRGQLVAQKMQLEKKDWRAEREAEEDGRIG